MKSSEDANPTADNSMKIGVSPIPKFSRPLITKTYATREEWMNAAIAAANRMATDEAFRKEIAEFIS